MGKMNAEKLAKMLAQEGLVVTIQEATDIDEFLRKLAKMAVAQYLREDEQPPNPDTNQNQITS